MTHEKSFTVSPMYGQIVVGDAGQGIEYPQFDSGQEVLVSSAYAVVVATRSDADGPVSVQVSTQDDPPAAGQASDVTEIFDDELLLPSKTLFVGSQLSQQFRTFDVAASARLRILVDHPGMASAITVSLTSSDA